MITVSQILDTKGHDVVTAHPDDTVLDGIRTMEARNIGAVAVVDQGRLVRTFSERHYARKVFLKGKSSPKTRIGEVMESHVTFATPENTVEDCMALMTESRVRHLPILDGDALVGMISIGDLVKSIISDQQITIDQLETYIRA